MKATVDKDTCTGCGLCVDTCPDVFEIDGDIASVKVGTVPPGAGESCREAMRGCPVDAISVEE